MGNGLTEHEFDHVFIGHFHHHIEFNTEEVAAYSFIATLIIGFAIEKTIGFRVARDVEIEGIDLGEHAETAYEMSSSSRGGAF